MIDSNKLKIFEKKINYKFKNNKLLIQSLTHPSFYLENEKKIKINEFERFESVSYTHLTLPTILRV